MQQIITICTKKYVKCEGFQKMVIFYFALLSIPFIWDDAKVIIINAEIKIIGN